MSPDPRAPESPAAGEAPGQAPIAPGDGAEPAASGGVPVRIRPAVAIVLAAGAVIAAATLYLDPSPAVRYGLVGVIALLYFVTKVKYWL